MDHKKTEISMNINKLRSYAIFIFLSEGIDPAMVESLSDALRATNFDTLCQEYDLNPSACEDVLENLAVIGSPVSATAPFFVVRYGPQWHQALVIEGWHVTKSAGKDLLNAFKTLVKCSEIQNNLEKTRIIFTIALTPAQLGDLGRLLAYEVARWAAFHGKGVMRGLDGEWYALNRHQAFVPLN
jgi:hypothetical protein